MRGKGFEELLQMRQKLTNTQDFLDTSTDGQTVLIMERT